MIRYSNKSDTPAVKKMFDRVFDEDLAFNQYFFDNIYKEEYALLYMEENILKAMVMELPYYMEGIGNVTYIYGVATALEYRNQGCMKTLLDYCHNNLKNPAVLIPANKELFDFYEKFGYKTAFCVQKNIVKKGDTLNLVETTPDVEKINYIYENALKAIPHINRSNVYWQKQMDMLSSLNGGVLYFENIGYCVYWLGEKPFIQEIFALNEENIKDICNYFCHKYNLEQVEYITKGNMSFGMMKNGECVQGYMNLMFN